MPPSVSSRVQHRAMPPLPDDITSCLARWPNRAQTAFATLRETVLTAARHAQIGEVIETLKWGQPSWRPAKPGIGSTLRCNWHPATPDRLSLYVHCQTNLLDTMRGLYPASFAYEGNRALHMSLSAPAPRPVVEHCALLTLTYHRKTA